MSLFRKKPVVVEAAQWFKVGDHPKVRHFTDPQNRTLEGIVYAAQICEHCEKRKGEHGWISTLEGGHIVCPGDWIITGVAGEFYPCKPDIFKQTYEPFDEPQHQARRFLLHRLEDVTGISGTGVIAIGTQYEHLVTLYWPSSRSVAIFPSLEELVKVHGHGGKTVIRWLD